MIKHRVKLIVAVVGIGAMLVAAVLSVGRLGRLVDYFGSGADPADALTTVGEFTGPGSHDLITWSPDRPQPARDLEPLSRESVADGYVRAWDDIAGGGAGGSDYVTGPAALAATATVEPPTVRHLGHRLELEFYSADGQVLVMNDELMVVRAAPAGDGRLIVTAMIEHYRSIMLLEDGNWRVRSLIRLEAGEPTVWFLDDPRPDSRVRLAGGAALLGILLFVPARLRRRGRTLASSIPNERN